MRLTTNKRLLRYQLISRPQRGPSRAWSAGRRRITTSARRRGPSSSFRAWADSYSRPADGKVAPGQGWRPDLIPTVADPISWQPTQLRPRRKRMPPIWVRNRSPTSNVEWLTLQPDEFSAPDELGWDFAEIHESMSNSIGRRPLRPIWLSSRTQSLSSRCGRPYITGPLRPPLPSR